MSTPVNNIPEAVVDPSTRDLISWVVSIIVEAAKLIGTAIYTLVNYLSYGLLALVKLVYKPLSFIIAPLAYLIRIFIACLQAPFKFLARFETLYIYLSVAALIGLSGGLLLSFVHGLLQAPLGLDTSPEPAGRTAKQYREKKQKDQAESEPFVLTLMPDSLSSGSLSMSDRKRKGGGKGKGLLNQTIMEEVDSDY